MSVTGCLLLQPWTVFFIYFWLFPGCFPAVSWLFPGQQTGRC